MISLAGPPAGAEMFRCADPDGSVRFTDDPSRCAAPAPHAPKAPIAKTAPAKPRADVPPPPPLGALRAMLPPGPGWARIEEAVERPAVGSQEAAQGLRGSLARHYTRYAGRVSEVCTIELWSFARPDQAALVRAALGRPNWWARAAGGLLVLGHGVRVERGVGTGRALASECAALAEAAHAAALAH